MDRVVIGRFVHDMCNSATKTGTSGEEAAKLGCCVHVTDKDAPITCPDEPACVASLDSHDQLSAVP